MARAPWHVAQYRLNISDPPNFAGAGWLALWAHVFAATRAISPPAVTKRIAKLFIDSPAASSGKGGTIATGSFAGVFALWKLVLP